MKSSLSACAFVFGLLGALASSGCGSSTAGTELLGSYTVMISSMGKTDPDVMTVTPGTDDKLLLTFVAGITTDAGAVNANGLRSSLKGSSMLSLEMQPVHIDHSTGSQSGMVTGEGALMGDGTATLTLHFTGGGATQDYDISGTKQ